MVKKILLEGLQKISGSIPLPWLRTLTQQHFILPFYHVISNASLPHVQHLYAVKNEHQFIADLDYLCQHYTPVSLEQVVDFVHHGKALPKHSFLLTFDDGLAECYHLVAPILVKKGIPATFFLNAAFVDNKALMFRYKASYLIEHCIQNKIPTARIQPFFQQEQLPFGNTKQALLSVRWHQQKLLDELALDLDINFDTFLKKKQPYLTTIQIKRMQKDGFDFGSHSIDHPTYNKLPLQEQIRQTVESQAFVNQKFAPTHPVFAFPFTDFGVSSDFFDEILQQQQFQLTFGGAGIKKEKIKGQLQRFAMEGQNNLSAKKILHTAYSYYIIKAFLGKNTIHR